jgi:hypothetical protein
VPGGQQGGMAVYATYWVTLGCLRWPPSVCKGAASRCVTVLPVPYLSSVSSNSSVEPELAPCPPGSPASVLRAAPVSGVSPAGNKPQQAHYVQRGWSENDQTHVRPWLYSLVSKTCSAASCILGTPTHLSPHISHLSTQAAPRTHQPPTHLYHLRPHLGPTQHSLPWSPAPALHLRS